MSLKAVDITEELKRKIFIEDLIQQGITHSIDGISIHELDYDTVKTELVLAAFRKMDEE